MLFKKRSTIKVVIYLTGLIFLAGHEVLQPYEIRIKELDSFVLRTREALLKCKKKVIKLARIRDIKLEVFSFYFSYLFSVSQITQIRRIFY